MTIELTILISVLSFSFAIYQGVSNMKRNQKQDAKSEATNMTTVIVKLENISTNITELKSSTKNFQEEIKDLRERQIRNEEKLENMNHRLDDFQKDLERTKLSCMPN